MSELPTKLSGLAPSDYNPRRITTEALDNLKKAMKKFGDLGGIVYNKRTGVVVSGHQRTKNMGSNLKITYPNGHKPDKSGDVFGEVTFNGKIFKIRIVDWDDEMEKAACVVANNDAIQGSWDMQALSELLVDHISYEDAFLDIQDIENSDFTPEQMKAIFENAGQEYDLDAMSESLNELTDINNMVDEIGNSAPGDSNNEFKDSIGTQVRKKVKDKDEALSYWRVVVGRDDKDAEEFMEELGLPKNNKYIQTDYLRAWKLGTEGSDDTEGSS